MLPTQKKWRKTGGSPPRVFVAPQLVVKSIAKWLGSLGSATSAQPPGGRGLSWRLIALTWSSATGCWFRIWEEKWLKEYCTTVRIDIEVWALLILVLGSLLKSPHIPPPHNQPSSLLTPFSSLLFAVSVYSVRHSSLGSQRQTTAPIVWTTGPTGTSSQTSLREDLPCWELRSALNCSFMALTPIERLPQPCESGLSSPRCGHFCIILTAEIMACDKTLYESRFLVGLSSHEKCVKSSVLLGT